MNIRNLLEAIAKHIAEDDRFRVWRYGKAGWGLQISINTRAK